jgi:hypothetical protein
LSIILDLDQFPPNNGQYQIPERERFRISVQREA